ncbi:MAG: hypothetical protein A2140_00810 [Candidatus Muproteobacteria bacterium RBG_16_62_13]|uniref:NlpC/P60 domain-containing protein n=1 Tax=Candidatus Muproteobacteria bacterium RBG_16_62_13 TaxID=1817756 RepID=A0A1F6T3U1_9PROT|nr:MAG: hypothetical protein A2140_00810 [Candidatus Muproteobacteria bacterium RBG_16_62_13]
MDIRSLALPGCLLLALLATGCASSPSSRYGEPRGPVSNTAANRAADVALAQIGTPYRHGGDNPRRGFDCSGLVNYSYRQAGLNLGHGTVYLRQYSRRISVSQLRRGDLVFFDQLGKRASHVGIYIGNGKFVHAPSTGKRVQTADFNSDYWRKHLNDVRRLDVY